MKTKYRVDIIESERGWGQKVEDVKFFDTEDEADTYCKQFNKDNNLPYVPDWYMVAQKVGWVPVP